ncbi:MAG: polysaccharide pyruvyl transferase CsaB [Oscillospiraceae bacterium]|nr:polysaccharide pyruvyl transferase CsaB [Oscillospiraceae bacterium]
MKVIHLISGGDVGGAKTHVHTLLKELSREIPVLLVCFKAGDFAEEAVKLGINVLVVEDGFFETLKKLDRLIEEGGYDIVHCHGSKANMYGAIIKLRRRVCVITTVHSDYRLDYLGRPLRRLTFGVINTLALRMLDYRICVSDHMKKLLIDRGFLPEGIFVIRNGVDHSAPSVAVPRGEFLARYGISEDCTVAGIAARLSPVKDIGTLIDAFAAASRKLEGLRLLIAGDGEEEASLKERAQRSGAADKIVFAGWLGDMDSFYNAVDINTLTSLSEGFPYSIVEGARMGCATVSSDVGGIYMLIKNGVTGCLFQPGDTAALSEILEKLGSDSSLRKRLGEAARTLAREEFSLDSMRTTQLEIYDTVLRRASRHKGKKDGATLCGAYGQGNFGDDSIMEAVTKTLRTIDRDMPVRVLSRRPKETMKLLDIRGVHSFDPFGIIKAMLRSKLYISGGGTLIQDVTSLRSLAYYLLNIMTARLCRCRVMMYGCGVGPVTSALGRRMTAFVLNRCVDRISLREPHSLGELRKLGVTVPDIEVTADPALVLSPAPAGDVDSTFVEAGIPVQGDYIAFSLRPWDGVEERLGDFAMAARYAYEKYGLSSVFIPIDKGRDIPVCRKVMELMGDAPSYLFGNISSADVAIGVISRMKLIVSMRLHALVFAAGQSVPVIGAVYDPKVSSFLDYVGVSCHAPLGGTDARFLTECIDRCLSGQEGPGAAAKLMELEKRNGEIAAELLEGHPSGTQNKE